MMRNFTRLTMMLVFFMGMVSYVNAQLVILTIDSPAEIKGNYSIIRAGFGDQTLREFNGELALANPIDACTAISNDLTGKVAMVDRGTCAFVQKVKAAQDKGAIAVLICNNDSEITVPGGTDATITIPSWIMDKTECTKIKVAVAAGTVNAIFRFKPCIPVPPSNAIWGTNSGEGDFDGGLHDWIVDTEPGKGWEWSADGDVGVNAYITAGTKVQTPTICNGAMLFNSDFLDNNGLQGSINQGTGSCPSPCVSSLISPNIDLSGVNVQGLSLQFSSGIRQFGSTYRLLVSTDNATTWSDTFNIMTEYPVNGPVLLNETVRVALCGVSTDITQIRFRFLCSGNYYYWAIDDVFLINDATADPQTNSFFAVAPNYKTPVSQAQDIAFLADVKNNGAIPSENTVLSADILKADGTSIHHQTYDFGTLAPCQQIKNTNFAELVKMPTEVGTYTVQYDINSSGNGVASNDIRRSNFMMTDNIFSKLPSEADFGSNYLFNLSSGVNTTNIGNYYSVGQYFFVPNGETYQSKSVTFGVADLANNAAFSGLVTASVFKVLGDLDGDGAIQGSERILVGRSEDPFYTVTNTTANKRNLTLDLYGVDDTGEVDLEKTIDLEDNSGYLVMLDVFPSSAVFFPFLSVNTATNTSLAFDYSAVDLAFDQLGTDWFTTVISNGGTANDNPFDRELGRFGINEIYLEWKIGKATGTNDINNDLAFDIYPNPVNDQMYVDMNLSNVSSEVQLEVYDLAGRKMMANTYSSIRTEKLTMNTSNLPSGMYVLKVITDEGFTSKKFMVQTK